MSEFVVISKQEFEEALPSGHKIHEDPRSNEIIYDLPTSDSRVILRVYSSIDKSGSVTRESGTDAIRCVLIDTTSKKPVNKGKRIHRMTNWKKHLSERIETLNKEVSSINFCHNCGSAMARRFRKGSDVHFYGCMRFPLCKATMNADGKRSAIIKEDVSDEKTVLCPRCDAPMKKRSGNRGEFYGCTNFFKTGCKGTRQAADVEMYGIGVVKEKEEEKPPPQKQQEIIDPVEQPDKVRVKIMGSLQQGPSFSLSDVIKSEETAEEQQYHDVPTDDSNVELVPTSEFPHMKFKFEKFNPVQSRVFQYYDANNNMIVAAATSAGKTTIAEMVMSNAISQGKKTIFLSPLKAVSQEKYEDWTDPEHGWSKLNVSIVTGDYALSESRVQELNEAHVIIMTTEMMDSRTRRIHAEKNDWLLKVGAVVCDESHLLTMKGRGDRVESAMMRFSKQNPSCRIVFLSATMPNVSELAAWLTSLNGMETELINSNYRPCQLDIHYEKYNDRGRYSDKESAKIQKAVDITQQHLGDKFIIFVHSKNTGRAVYKYLNDMGEHVELHNAELSLDDRIRVAESFKSKEPGSLRIIVATSTLAWGVNLPARRVIVTGVHRGLSKVEPLDIKQEVGRSGRVGFDPKGDAYVLLPSSEYRYYKQWCENIPPIISTMNNQDTLAFHIVSEVSEGVVYDVNSLMEWYNRSLAAFQNDFLDRVEAEELLDKLVKIKILDKVGEKYKITNLGRIAAHLYFSPYSIAGWYMNFNRVFESGVRDSQVDDVMISWALANIPENNENFVPKEYVNQVASFKAKCQLKGVSVFDSIGWVGLLYWSCLTYNQDVSELHKRTAKFDIERTINALQIIDQRCTKWNRADFWRRLQVRIEYEISYAQTELCTLKGVGGAYVRKLFDADVQTISTFVEYPDNAIHALGKKTYYRILQQNNLV